MQTELCKHLFATDICASLKKLRGTLCTRLHLNTAVVCLSVSPFLVALVWICYIRNILIVETIQINCMYFANEGTVLNGQRVHINFGAKQRLRGETASMCIFKLWPEADYGLPNSLKLMVRVIIELNYLLTCLLTGQLIDQIQWEHSNKQPINTAQQERRYCKERKYDICSKYPDSVSIAAGYCGGKP